MQFWHGVLVLSLLAAMFILWPTLFVKKKYKKELRTGVGDHELDQVFDHHLKDLEQTRNRGEIEQQDYDNLKQDLENTLIEESSNEGESTETPFVSSFKSRLPVIALVIVVPIFALLIYSSIGSKSDWEIYSLMTQQVTNLDEAKTRAENLTKRLQKRLKSKPENASNWYLLASTSMEMGNYDEAVRAYREVLNLSPEAPRIMAELAQALFSRAGNTITPEVRSYTEQALAIAPMMPTALGLAGVDAYQAGDYELAIRHWQNATSQLDPSSAAYQVLSSGVDKAQKALEQTGKVAPTVSQVEAADKPSIDVKVSLDKSVVSNPDDVVFIYARAWKGPKMPLAIKRITAADLPASVTLSESMMPGMDLSSFPQVEVVARLSPGGSAVPTSGDWQAAQGPVIVANQKEPVVLNINTLIE